MTAKESADKDGYQLMLCQGHDPCCPTVSVFSDHLDIRDDEGGSVRLTKDQFRVLMEHSPKILARTD